MTKLYQNVEIIRKDRKIKSIRQLEILAGITIGTINKWKKRPPGLEHLIKLSTYLEISMESLLGINENNLSQQVIHDPNLDRIINEIVSLNIDKRTADIVIKVLQAVICEDTEIESSSECCERSDEK